MSTHLWTELTSQPATWRRGVHVARATSALPRPGQSVAAVGCGTSWFVAQSYATLREQSGQGVTDAFSASQFPIDRDYDCVVLISRSGTTTEVQRVAEALRTRGTRQVALVASADSPVGRAADACVELPFADEQSVVQTRFATTALAVLRHSVGDDLEPVAAQAEEVVAARSEDLFTPELLGAEQVTFLAEGWGVGMAHEAALKLRESVQFWTESYPLMEYRHGPIAIASPGRAVWVLGALPQDLAEQVAATGAHIENQPDRDPMAELVRVHRYCAMRAEAAGLDPDAPRHLTRSIILS